MERVAVNAPRETVRREPRPNGLIPRQRRRHGEPHPAAADGCRAVVDDLALPEGISAAVRQQQGDAAALGEADIRRHLDIAREGIFTALVRRKALLPIVRCCARRGSAETERSPSQIGGTARDGPPARRSDRPAVYRVDRSLRILYTGIVQEVDALLPRRNVGGHAVILLACSAV